MRRRRACRGVLWGRSSKSEAKLARAKTGNQSPNKKPVDFWPQFCAFFFIISQLFVHLEIQYPVDIISISRYSTVWHTSCYRLSVSGWIRLCLKKGNRNRAEYITRYHRISGYFLFKLCGGLSFVHVSRKSVAGYWGYWIGWKKIWIARNNYRKAEFFLFKLRRLKMDQD